MDANKNRKTKALKPYAEQKAVPKCLQPEILRLYHDVTLSHGGTDRTYAAISANWHWSSLYADVGDYIKYCQECQQSKSYSLCRANLLPYPIERFGSRLHCDIVGPLKETDSGAKYIFSVIDSFTNVVWIFDVDNYRSDTLAEKLLTVCAFAGPPRSLVSDCGSSFVGNLMTSFCKLMGIQKINVSPGHQSSNGKCERMHKTLGEALRAITGSDSNWNLKLPMLEMSFRTAEIAGLGITPHELVFGTKPRTIADILVPESHENGPTDDMHEYVQDLKLRLQTIHDITANNIAENQVKMKSAYDAKILRSKTYNLTQFGSLIQALDPTNAQN